MVLRQIRIGSASNVIQYDDGSLDSAIETDQPIKAGAPVDPNDVLRLTDITTAVLAIIYHIGSIYISVDATNPATRFGFGTWVAFGAGRVLVGINAADTDFDTVEEVGGSKTSTPDAHSGAAVDAHSGSAVADHTKVVNVQGALAGDVVTTPDHAVTQPADHVVTQPASHAALSVVQPYIVVYMWKRTA